MVSDFRLIDISTKKYPSTFTKVSPEDYDILNQWKWSLGTDGYARRSTRPQRKRNTPTKTIRMHIFILGAKSGDVCDHINGDKLDNRRENLRITNASGNTKNSRPHKGRKFKGVFKCTKGQYWEAKIGVRDSDGKKRSRSIGTYKTEEDAARAYDNEARKEFGEYAYLNFPNSTDVPIKNSDKPAYVNPIKFEVLHAWANDKNVTQAELSERFGVSVSTIKRLLRGSGIIRQRGKLTDEQKNEIRALYKTKGMTSRKLAALYDVSYTTILTVVNVDCSCET